MTELNEAAVRERLGEIAMRDIVFFRSRGWHERAARVEALLVSWLAQGEALAAAQQALREIANRGPDRSSADQWASFPRWAKIRADEALASLSDISGAAEPPEEQRGGGRKPERAPGEPSSHPISGAAE